MLPFEGCPIAFLPAEPGPPTIKNVGTLANGMKDCPSVCHAASWVVTQRDTSGETSGHLEKGMGTRG